MKPLKLRTRHMPTKVTKPPKKGKGAKYSRSKEKRGWRHESIKIRKIVESILKVHRVRLLVERIVLDESVTTWPSGFTIGPNQKVVPLDGSEMIYHGQTIKFFPTVYKAALKVYHNNEDEIEDAARAGSGVLYDIMYDTGMVRGGRYWVAFNSRKVPSKSLMTILKLAKLGNVKYFDVDDGPNGKYYNNVSVDEFIEKFL